MTASQAHRRHPPSPPTTALHPPTVYSPAAVSGDPERILLRGGTILTMDDSVGNLPVGDLLIEGDTIARIGEHIHADATVVDASGMIVVPGFCDPHIHAWQGQLARIIPNNDDLPNPTRNYRTVVHETFAPVYRPEDMYIGTLLSLLAAVSGGITTVCDNSHNSRSPEHVDAAIQAMDESGVRGLFAYGQPRSGQWDPAYGDLERVRSRFFPGDADGDRLRVYVRGRASTEELMAALRARRELDLWLTVDGARADLPLHALYADGWLTGRESYSHGIGIASGARRLIAERGATVNVCPRIETQFRTGHIPFRDWLAEGVGPGLSNDNPATYSLDMFQEMRALYAYERAWERRQGRERPLEGTPPITLRDVLAAATVGGAANCGLTDQVGSLRPGKKADIVMLRTDNVHTHPVHNVYATVVQGAGLGCVDTVFIGGRVAKWRGGLLGFDFPALKRAADDSRDYLFSRAGWPLHPIDFTD